MVAAGAEVTLWNMNQENPISILDTGKSSSVFALESKLSSKGRFIVSCTSSHQISVFKLNFQQPKKSAQAVTKLTLEKQDGYLQARILSNTQLQCLHGTIFGVS